MQQGIRISRRRRWKRETPRRRCPVPPGGSIRIGRVQASAGWRPGAAASPVGRLYGPAQVTPVGGRALPAGAPLISGQSPEASGFGFMPSGGDCNAIPQEAPSVFRSGAETAAIGRAGSGQAPGGARRPAEPQSRKRGSGFADPGRRSGGCGGSMALEDSSPLRGRLYVRTMGGLTL